MSDPAGGGHTGLAPGGHNPWVVAVVVSIATFMEVLDTTIANVALRNIAGGLAVGPDEAAWVVTTYLVANAIVLCASGWAAVYFGRKRFYMACVLLFTISSVACGFATSLDQLLLFRIMQGLGGGGMAPVSQSILTDSFPPQKRGQAFALYGIAVVVAPVVGPTLGGWITDNYSWHWVFLINAPVGVLSLALVHLCVEDSAAAVKKRKEAGRRLNFDFVGFALLATALGSLEVVLDQGQRDDWFGSNFIVAFAIASGFAFIAFVPWALSRNEPIIDLRLLLTRQFGMCFVVMLATGAILIATTQFLPELTQTLFGYNATLAGLVLAPGGLVTMFMMFVIGRVSGKVQPKYLIATGAAVIALGMYKLTSLNPDTTFAFFAWSRIYIGVGLPLIFISITSASYDGIRPDQTDQASAMINMARNLGGSMGVSLAQTVLAQRTQFHQSRLVEHVYDANPHYQTMLKTLQHYFTGRGATLADATQQAIAAVGRAVAGQASLLGYTDVFFMLCLLSASAIPLALLLRSVKLGGAPVGGH